MSTMAERASAARAEPRALSAVDWGLFALRLGLGIIFVAHGAQKVFGLFGGQGLAATVESFSTNLGIPAPLGYLAAFTELFGGLAVLLGVLSRTAALGLAILMVVAALKVHLPNGFFLSGPGQSGPGIEYNVALFAMAVAVMLAGPGRLAFWDPEVRLLSRSE